MLERRRNPVSILTVLQLCLLLCTRMLERRRNPVSILTVLQLCLLLCTRMLERRRNTVSTLTVLQLRLLLCISSWAFSVCCYCILEQPPGCNQAITTQ